MLELDRPDEGVDAATQGLGCDPEDLDLINVFALCQLSRGAPSLAFKALTKALESSNEQPLLTAHLEQALTGERPSTLEWLATARNYVEFANKGGLYDEVRSFLVSREAKAWRE